MKSLLEVLREANERTKRIGRSASPLDILRLYNYRSELRRSRERVLTLIRGGEAV